MSVQSEPAVPPLEDRRTVDRGLAQTWSVERVMITGTAREGDLLLAQGELPRQHLLHNDTPVPRHDVLAIAEFTRQALEVLSHAELDVPEDNFFVLRSLEVELLDHEATLIGPEPAVAVVALPLAQVRRNRRGAYAASGPVPVQVNGQVAARFGGTVAFLAPPAYHGIRRRAGASASGFPQGATVPLAPARVGRQVAANVMVGEVGGPPRELRGVVVPTSTPTFFDRPTDHYPGMMITEAARQLALVALAEDAGADPASILTTRASADFLAFAELDTPLHLRVTRWSERPDGSEITVEAHQGDRVATACAFRLALTR